MKSQVPEPDGESPTPSAATGASSPPTAPLLEARSVGKTYGPVRVLSNVTLSVNRREVVGFIGENGAGKSTLLNILTGTVRQDEGEVFMKGHPVAFGNYHDATKHGVFRIFQELAMVPNLAIYENLFLSHEEHFSRGGVISRRRMINRAKDMLAQFDHGWVDPRREASSYDFSTRQVVEIIKAFALAELLEVETPVILLDEPTAGLSREEIDFFGGVLRSISDRAGVVFVSHRLSELLEFSSRIYVIKDGEVVAQPNPNEITESELHHLMVGRKRDETFYKEWLQREPETTSALRVRGLQRTPDFTDVDLEVRAGEIVGIAGVLGSGKSEFARAIFEPPADRLGEVSVGDQPVKQHQISAMLDAGVGYVSPDRHKDGIILGFPVAWNISLSALPAVRRWLLKPARERLDAKKHIESLRIKTNGPDAMAGTLSGGNQQKVILAKWLERKPKVLILDNPTKGVDAGAKEDIYGILRQFVADGGGILLVSDELVELIGLSNRVVVMKDGKVVHEIATPFEDKPHETDLVAHMV